MERKLAINEITAKNQRIVNTSDRLLKTKTINRQSLKHAVG